MTRAAETRYVIQYDESNNPSLFRHWKIWDRELNAFCGLPTKDGGHEELAFHRPNGAQDWLRKCQEAGLPGIGSLGLTMTAYRLNTETGVMKRLAWMAVAPPDRAPRALFEAVMRGTEGWEYRLPD